MLKVEGDVAEFFLDVTNDFTLGGGCERVATLGQDFHEVVGQITTSEVETEDGVGKGVSLKTVMNTNFYDEFFFKNRFKKAIEFNFKS